MGQGEPKEAVRYMANAAVMLFGCGIFLCIVTQIFLEPLLRFFGSPADVLEYAKTYTRITALGFPFLILTSGGGQLLLCVDGEGWYQEAGKPARSLKPGDVVTIPAEVKHWHGAKAHSWFSHLAVEVPGENTSNEWCEPVSDADYAALEN